MADFREVVARGRRLGKAIGVVWLLLFCVGFGVGCVVVMIGPLRFSPTAMTPSWFGTRFVWLVEYVAQHTGLSSQTVALVIVRLFLAVMVAGCVGVIKEAWDEWEYSRKALVKALAAGVAVIGLIVGGLLWVDSSLALMQHPAPAGPYPVRAIPQSAWVPTPAPLQDAFVIMLAALFGLFRMAGQNRMAYQRPGSLAARRAGLGAACLAVVALVVVSSSNDVGGFARLVQFAGQLFSTPQSWTLWATLVGLGLLLFIGGVCLAVGLAGPFVRDGIELAKDFGLFVVVAGLWAWGAFLPPDFTWFDDLGMATGLRTFNFGLLCWYLFTAVESGLGFLLTVGGGGTPSLPPPYGPRPPRPVPR